MTAIMWLGIGGIVDQNGQLSRQKIPVYTVRKVRIDSANSMRSGANLRGQALPASESPILLHRQCLEEGGNGLVQPVTPEVNGAIAGIDGHT